jgi:hypothetical protein
MSRELYTAHVAVPELAKLSQLRARTDRQIVNLLHSKIEAGLNFAALAEAEDSNGHNPWKRADQALTEVQQLLPILNDQQRRELNPKLAELREALNRVGEDREAPRSFTASTF